MSELHVFRSDLPEWVIATSAEDALAVWCKAMGLTPADFDKDDEWVQLPDDHVLKFWTDENGGLSDGGTLTPMTAKQAVEKFGHGFHASSEW